MKEPAKDTLVAILKFKEDLEIAKQAHWYRIPVRTAPNMVRDGSLRYLALYQPKAFAPRAFQIAWYAKVAHVGIAKRVELLPDAPRHPRAHDDYYKIEISRLRELPTPVISRKRRRIIFITTTYGRFRRAREINDLFWESPIEEQLWTALKRKRIEAERQYWLMVDDDNFFLDFAVFAKRGRINVECDGDAFHTSPSNVKRDKRRDNLLVSSGWSVLRYTTDDIANRLSRCTRQIQQTLDLYGGIAAGDL